MNSLANINLHAGQIPPRSCNPLLTSSKKGGLLQELAAQSKNKGVTFSVSKVTAKNARKSIRKVTIEGTGKNLSTHAGLIPIMKFLTKLGFRDSFRKVVHHTRGNNARYQLCDAVE